MNKENKTNEFIYKKIPKCDERQFLNLIKAVMEDLKNTNKEYFFMGYSKNDLENLFNEDLLQNYGAYDNEKLVGVVTGYLSQDRLKGIKATFDDSIRQIEQAQGIEEHLGIPENTQVTDISTLTLPEYRGRGIATHLIGILKDEIGTLGYDYMLATAHPDNLPSKISLTHAGLNCIEEARILRNGAIRNLYLSDYLPELKDTASQELNEPKSLKLTM